jgi:hypothetical protein
MKVYAARTEVLNLAYAQANSPPDQSEVEKYLEQKQKKEAFKVPSDALVLNLQAFVIHAKKEVEVSANFRKLFQINKEKAQWKSVPELHDVAIGLSPERILVVAEAKSNFVWIFDLWPGHSKMYLGTDCGMNFFQGVWGTKVALVEDPSFLELLWKAARLDPDQSSSN